MSKAILVYDNGDVEVVAAERGEDARYWVERRIEKEGKVAIEGYWVIPDNMLPVCDWVTEYGVRLAKENAEYHERQERRAYERLKKKYDEA